MGQNPALIFQRLVSKAKSLTVCFTYHNPKIACWRYSYRERRCGSVLQCATSRRRRTELNCFYHECALVRYILIGNRTRIRAIHDSRQLRRELSTAITDNGWLGGYDKVRDRVSHSCLISESLDPSPYPPPPQTHTSPVDNDPKPHNRALPS